MTNINQILLDRTSKHLYKYDCWRKEIASFLEFRGTFIERQKRAIDIMEAVMTAHGKKELLRQLSELARVEYGIRELEPEFRDHVVHALLSFILGIYINENYLGKIFNMWVDNFQWELAGLLHDIGYPIEISAKVMRPFTDKINEIKKSLNDSRPDIYFRVVPVGLESLANGISSLSLVQERLKNWGLKMNVGQVYREANDSGKIDHGAISSLSVLYLIDMIYENHNPGRKYRDICLPGTNINFNQKYFERDVVSACAAIFIHNLPQRYFNNSRINFGKSPVAFLLKLSDCLQQWERPSKERPNGFSADQFAIRIDNDQLIFQAKVPSDKKTDIETEILSTLDTTNVQIVG